jgi:hypothetical protein
MFHRPHIVIALTSALVGTIAHGAASQEEAKQLGGDKLTLIGAEATGNKDGSIPPYGGKAPKPPAAYDVKDPGQRPDPYNDKPLYTITAKNVDKYADKLDAMREVFVRYPEFRMDVYPTRRDIEYPKYVLENTAKNATSCKGARNELRLEGCYGGFPFPIPKTGNQVMWNHLLQYGAHAYGGKTSSWVTTPDGQAVLQTKVEQHQQFDYFDPKNSKANPSDMIYWSIAQSDIAPARKVGNKLVVLDSLDMVDKGRRVYQYIPGQRRVKLAPNLAYDTPSPNSGGTSTMDDAKGFLGALDRYDFKLIGKKEKYIMYNTFALTNHQVCTDQKVVEFKNFPNPECVRWELHRVWVVEATLKSGFRHVYPRRVFYWDEDAPGAGSTESYDAANKLYRIANTVAVPFYEGQLGVYTDSTMQLDLQTGSWFVQGLAGFPGGGHVPVKPLEDRAFSPEAMAGEGVR